MRASSYVYPTACLCPALTGVAALVRGSESGDRSGTRGASRAGSRGFFGRRRTLSELHRGGRVGRGFGRAGNEYCDCRVRGVRRRRYSRARADIFPAGRQFWRCRRAKQATLGCAGGESYSRLGARPILPWLRHGSRLIAVI